MTTARRALVASAVGVLCIVWGTVALRGQAQGPEAQLISRAAEALGGRGRILAVKTLQIIGYGEGKDAIFLRVVLICGESTQGSELGLVTNETLDASGARKLIVFVPGAPNPTGGRLIVIDAARTVPLSVSVSDALKTLLSVGKTPLSLAPESGSAAPHR